MTNFERIKKMSHGELARVLVAHIISKEYHDFNCGNCECNYECDGNCVQHCLAWLNKETDNETD